MGVWGTEAHRTAWRSVTLQILAEVGLVRFGQFSAFRWQWGTH